MQPEPSWRDYPTNGRVNSVAVRALTTTCAQRIDTATCRDLLTEDPQVALRVIDDTTALLAQARTDVTEQSTAAVAQRIATTLLRLAGKFGQDASPVRP